MLRCFLFSVPISGMLTINLFLIYLLVDGRASFTTRFLSENSTPFN